MPVARKESDEEFLARVQRYTGPGETDNWEPAEIQRMLDIIKDLQRLKDPLPLSSDDPLTRIRNQAGPSEEDFLWMVGEIDRLRRILIPSGHAAVCISESLQAADNREISRQRDELLEEKNAAYCERNQVVAALAKLVVAISGDEHYKHLRAGIRKDLDAEKGWTTVVLIDYPTGQVSWHIPDNEQHLFAALPFYDGEWDGHTTQEKYERLAEDL
jgi:hypothetical protein